MKRKTLLLLAAVAVILFAVFQVSSALHPSGNPDPKQATAPAVTASATVAPDAETKAAQEVVPTLPPEMEVGEDYVIYLEENEEVGSV